MHQGKRISNERVEQEDPVGGEDLRFEGPLAGRIVFLLVIVEQREFNLFADIKAVEDVIEKPDQFVNPMFFGEDVDQQNTMLPKVPDGIDVRIKSGEDNSGNSWGGLSDVSSVEPERVYRVEVTTTVGAVRKRMTAVYDMKYARSQSTGEGAWLYYRQE